MRTISFFVPGVPTAKGRPRMTRTGRAYTPAKTKRAEETILGRYLTHVDPHDVPHEGPVCVTIAATFPKPKSWPKWKREHPKMPHCGKPDLDNLIKVLDALNGVAWRDDSQVFDVIAHKHYGDVPGVQYTIDFLDEVTR